MKKMMGKLTFVLALAVIITATVNQNSFASVTDGLIAYFPLDGDATDHSGNGNHGEIVRAWPCEDRFGNPRGAMCVGIGESYRGYINIGNKIKPPFPFTITAWIKPEKLDLSEYGQHIIRNDLWGWYYHGAVVFFGPSGHLGGAYGDGGYNVPWSRRGAHTSVPVIVEGVWQHVAIVFNAHLDIRIYYDGKNFPINWSDGYGSTMRYSNQEGAIGLGSPRVQFVNSYRGGIDDVRFYNRGLSSHEIEKVFNGGNGFIGDIIQIKPRHEFSVEKNYHKEVTVDVYNSGGESLVVNSEILNVYSGLEVSIKSDEEISIAPGELKSISVSIDAGLMPAGVYDSLLFKISDQTGNVLYSNLTIHIVEPGQADLPDLTLRAEDIRLADYTLGESATLSAVIHNKGQTAASDVLVEFYEFGTFLGETVVAHVPANGSATATLITPITTQGERIIRVVIDPFDEIHELDIANNEASQIVRVGESTEPISGHILVTGNLSSNIYTDSLFTLCGKAVYDIFVNGIRYTNYVVKGGSVEITILDEFGNEWVYGGVHTNINGHFAKTLQAPSGPGTYTISLAVTDKTFVGKRNLMFAAVERPPQEPSPPLPPIMSGSGYSGYWSYSEPTGTWSWTWTARPVNEPTPKSDLRVFSENIHFTNNNPAPGEETTIFAKIQYWAEKSDMVAENVPINFYVTYPGTPRLKIAETIIDRLSVGAPDYGGRFVYASMRDWQEGIYLAEVEIDPSYMEENRMNNAATRALIVGQLQSFHGAIAGQVLDAWGGVVGIQLRLYTQDGQLVGNSLTGSNGYYHFDNLPVGEYTVNILAPLDYWVDAETKAATVEDQAVSEVGFQLNQEEPAWDAIEDLTARVKDGKVQLVWTHLLGTSLYEIYRGTSNGGPYVKVGETISDFSTYLDQDVVNGITYHYIVRRLWGADSSDSNEAVATPTMRVRR